MFYLYKYERMLLIFKYTPDKMILSFSYFCLGLKKPPSIEFIPGKGLFRCKVFLHRAFILEHSSLDEMKGI